MKLVIFYSKAGCKTNTKQKKILRNSGCIIIERSLLHHDMESNDLLMFFQDKPINEWFNPNAPSLKSGELDISQIDQEEALHILMSNPLLIKRPLLIVKNEKLCGFNQEKIEELLEIKLENNFSHGCSI